METTFAASCSARTKEVLLGNFSSLLLTEKKEGVARRRGGLRPEFGKTKSTIRSRQGQNAVHRIHVYRKETARSDLDGRTPP